MFYHVSEWAFLPCRCKLTQSVFVLHIVNKMASCFCREKKSRSSADAVITMEAEMVPMGPLENSDDDDFENVQVVEER